MKHVGTNICDRHNENYLRLVLQGFEIPQSSIINWKYTFEGSLGDYIKL